MFIDLAQILREPVQQSPRWIDIEKSHWRFEETSKGNIMNISSCNNHQLIKCNRNKDSKNEISSNKTCIQKIAFVNCKILSLICAAYIVGRIDNFIFNERTVLSLLITNFGEFREVDFGENVQAVYQKLWKYECKDNFCEFSERKLIVGWIPGISVFNLKSIWLQFWKSSKTSSENH